MENISKILSLYQAAVFNQSHSFNSFEKVAALDIEKFITYHCVASGKGKLPPYLNTPYSISNDRVHLILSTK